MFLNCSAWRETCRTSLSLSSHHLHTWPCQEREKAYEIACQCMVVTPTSSSVWSPLPLSSQQVQSCRAQSMEPFLMPVFPVLGKALPLQCVGKALRRGPCMMCKLCCHCMSGKSPTCTGVLVLDLAESREFLLLCTVRFERHLCLYERKQQGVAHSHRWVFDRYIGIVCHSDSEYGNV